MSVPFISWIMAHELWWDWLVFLIALVIQLWLLKEWQDVNWVVTSVSSEDDVAPHMQQCYEQDNNYLGVCPSQFFYFTIVTLGEPYISRP